MSFSLPHPTCSVSFLCSTTAVHDQSMPSASPATLSTPPVPPLRSIVAMRDHVVQVPSRPIDSDALVRPVRVGGPSLGRILSEDKFPQRQWMGEYYEASNLVDQSALLPLTHARISGPFGLKENKFKPVKSVKTARRKEQCRTNQARYRERQKIKLAKAEEKVACLRELVGLLEVQRAVCASYGPAFARHVIVTLFRRFRRGLSGSSFEDRPAQAQTPLEWTGVGRAGRNPVLLKQIAFIRCAASENVDLGSGLEGPDALLEQLWKYSTLYTNFRLELLGIHQLTASHSKAERVVVDGRFSVDVTEKTLDVVFPGLREPLRRKLLGRTLANSIRLDFEFEEVDGSLLMEITRLVPQIEFVEALMRVLCDPFEIEEVLHHGQMTLDGWICVDP